MTQDTAPIGVLMAQLGTPAAPTPQAVRRFLAEFLSDRRVVDYPPLLWQSVLRGVILRVRPRRSAALYQRIWREDGSPLMVFSERQRDELAKRLDARYDVRLGMTYLEPSIQRVIGEFEALGIDRILVLPMFPQYSSTTTASVYDAVYRAAAGKPSENKRHIPTLRFVPPYYDHPGYIHALAAHLRRTIEEMPQPPARIIFSYHGNPARYDRTGDPYRSQCERTTQLLAEALGLDEAQWVLSFQSRFGPEEWLQPYTDDVIEESARQGIAPVLVFSPGFTTDCLETLDELGNEGREAWEEHGGKADSYVLAPCLNEQGAFMDALADIVRREAQGWA